MIVPSALTANPASAGSGTWTQSGCTFAGQHSVIGLWGGWRHVAASGTSDTDCVSVRVRLRSPDTSWASGSTYAEKQAANKQPYNRSNHQSFDVTGPNSIQTLYHW